MGEVPELVVADAEVALVAGVAGVDGGEPLAGGQAGAVVLFGGGGVPECDGEVPELAVDDGEVALVGSRNDITYSFDRRMV